MKQFSLLNVALSGLEQKKTRKEKLNSHCCGSRKNVAENFLAKEENYLNSSAE
jgi:hypothetical protein